MIIPISGKWSPQDYEFIDYAMSHPVLETVQYIESSGIASQDIFYKIAILFAQTIPQNPLSHPKLDEMFQHVHATARFVQPSFNKLKGSINLEFIPLGFTECCCFDNAFHRFKSPRRNHIDKEIVKRIKECVSDKTKPVRVLSMGSGGLMPEFILIEKMILEGFKNIIIDCVEPFGIAEELIFKMQNFFDDYPDATVKVQAFKDIEDVPPNSFHVVFAVDYSDLAVVTNAATLKCTADLMKAFSRLKETGFLALGFAQNNDNLFGPKFDFISLNKVPSSFYESTIGAIERLPKKKELVLALPDFRSGNLPHLSMLATSLATKRFPVHFENVFVTCMDDLNFDLDKKILPDFKKMMEALFPHTKIEITLGDAPTNKEVDINFTL